LAPVALAASPALAKIGSSVPLSAVHFWPAFFGVERARIAGQALDDDFGILVDENGH